MINSYVELLSTQNTHQIMRVQDSSYSREFLNTPYSMVVYNYGMFVPEFMDLIICDTETNYVHNEYDHNYNYQDIRMIYIRDIASQFLQRYGHFHDIDCWTIETIRYNLYGIEKQNNISSGLAWHCENDNGKDLISVLFYLRKDGTKQTLNIHSGMTVIMDGRVYHKPQEPYGSDRRDLIIVSFEKPTK